MIERSARPAGSVEARRRGNNRGGVTRLAGILLGLIAVMLVVIAVPVWQFYKNHADEIGCAASLKTARDSLAIEVITERERLTEKTSYETLARTMPGRDRYCPAGGTIYLLSQENGTYNLVCGLHDSDKKQRTRLNAAYVLGQLDEALRALREGEEIPPSVTLTVNSQELECVAVPEELRLRRGTSTTEGYEGVVAFFAVAGQAGWEDVGAEDGEICYFVYADEDYCALWHERGGWGGDSYK